MTYYLLEATLNGCIREFYFFFFTINLFSLINGMAFLLYHNRPHCQRHTNADLKISLYVCAHVKTVTRKFRILNPKNSRVIYPLRLQIS